MAKRKILDHSRSYGEISPPVAGACFVQDGLDFDHNGVQIANGETFDETPGQAAEAAQSDEAPAFELSDLGKQVQVLCDPELPPPDDLSDEARGNYALLQGWRNLTWPKQMKLAKKLVVPETRITKGFAFGVFEALAG